MIVVILGLAAAGGAWAWWNGSIGSVAIREHCTVTASGMPYELDPDQASNAAIITSIAGRRGLPARAASIALATALQESKLRNVQYGDRDSLGLFQQRPSQGWGTRKQILNPVYATNAFYDVLSKVDGFETMPITKVAQKVQHSAFPSAYADHEPEAKVIASALSGYSPAGFNCVLHSTQVAAQSVVSGGLTARAKAVSSAADTETGRDSVTAAGHGGTALRFTVPAQTNDRAAWSLAQWAVARANGLEIVQVDVAGHRWDRQHSTDGWTTVKNGLPSTAVQIQVA